MLPPTLSPFERTNFFYGLLLDAERLQRDHAFFNGKRWMLNRLALGSGVLCGLGVRSVAGPPAAWFVDAGVAIDPLGREIVVPGTCQFNPAQPTDTRGHAVGAPLAAVGWWSVAVVPVAAAVVLAGGAAVLRRRALPLGPPLLGVTWIVLLAGS